MEKQSVSFKRIIFFIIVLLECMIYVFIFSEYKTGYHEDEFFSYALSNSYYRPYLYGSDLQVMDNYDVWLTGDDFKYYIRTNDKTKFKYDSVWYNQKTDTNPPLYYALLHTISSFFSNDFSWWYAFSINIVCFIVSQVFLFLISIQLSRSYNFAVAVCIFYPFTIAAQGDNLFLRMYCMLTMFTLMYTYFSLKFISNKEINKRDFAFVAFAALAGALTQHLFLIIAFLISFSVCMVLIIKKQFMKFIRYGMTAGIAVLLSFIMFPATYQHLFHSRFSYSHEPEIFEQIKLLSDLILKSSFGISLYQINDILFYMKIIIMFIIPILLPLLFLVRDKIPSVCQKTTGRLRSFFNYIKPFIVQHVTLVISCIIFLIIVSSRFYYYDFDEDSIRYVYCIIPLLICSICSFFYLLVKSFSAKCVRCWSTLLCSALLAVSLVVQNYLYNPQYIIQANSDNGRIAEYTHDSNCILLVLNPVYMPVFSKMFEESNNVYETVMKSDYYREDIHLKEYQKLFDKTEPFMLIFDGTTLFTEEFIDSVKNNEASSFEVISFNKYGEKWTEKEVVSYFENISGYKAEYCTSETTHFNRIIAYRFEPDDLTEEKYVD